MQNLSLVKQSSSFTPPLLAPQGMLPHTLLFIQSLAFVYNGIKSIDFEVKRIHRIKRLSQKLYALDGVYHLFIHDTRIISYLYISDIFLLTFVLFVLH